MSYISRFILCTGLLSGVLFSGGCRKGDFREVQFLPEDTALVDAMLILHCNDMQTKAETREEQEKQINDLNLFFVHQFYPSVENPEVRHYYFSSVDMAKHIKLANIRLGKYRLYAVANAGQKLCSDSHDPLQPDAVGESFCSLTEEEIKALTIEIRKTDLKPASNLLMSSVDKTMEIKRAKHVGSNTTTEENIEPISISLKRQLAKIAFSYELIDDAVGKLELNSIIPQYVPFNFALFDENGNKPSAEEDFNIYVDPFLNIPKTGISKEDPLIFYWPENMQGTVAGIFSQQDRNGLNAPHYASYIYLDGKYEENQYGFSIYFGDDMEGGNFDLRGNAFYRMHLQLGGPDLDDIRVSSLKINVTKPFIEEGSGSIKLGETAEAFVELICSNYFNDEVKLLCSATGAREVATIQVYHLQDESDMEGVELENVSEHEGFVYMMLKTDNQPGTQKVRCRITFTQNDLGDGERSVTIMFKLTTRYGTTTFYTEDIRVTPF